MKVQYKKFSKSFWHHVNFRFHPDRLTRLITTHSCLVSDRDCLLKWRLGEFMVDRCPASAARKDDKRNFLLLLPREMSVCPTGLIWRVT